jgi:signal transduction histidine kinase
MQARAAALGGSLRIESAEGKGTRVLLTLPVASPA